VSLDLFGSETSTNAANYFAAGLKGRFQEERREDDHRLKDDYRLVPEVTGAGIGTREVTQLAALNETLRDDYGEDCEKGLTRWNRSIAEAGVDMTLALPHTGFHRNVGTFRDHRVSPTGQLIDESTWQAGADEWLPSEADRAHVQSLMVGATDRATRALRRRCPSSRPMRSTSSSSGAVRPG